MDNNYTSAKWQDKAWDEMASSLDQHMPEKKRRYAIYWWILAGVLLLAVGTVAIVQWQAGAQDASSQTSTSSDIATRDEATDAISDKTSPENASTATPTTSDQSSTATESLDTDTTIETQLSSRSDNTLTPSSDTDTRSSTSTESVETTRLSTAAYDEADKVIASTTQSLQGSEMLYKAPRELSEDTPQGTDTDQLLVDNDLSESASTENSRPTALDKVSTERVADVKSQTVMERVRNSVSPIEVLAYNELVPTAKATRIMLLERSLEQSIVRDIKVARRPGPWIIAAQAQAHTTDFRKAYQLGIARTMHQSAKWSVDLGLHYQFLQASRSAADASALFNSSRTSDVTINTGSTPAEGNREAASPLLNIVLHTHYLQSEMRVNRALSDRLSVFASAGVARVLSVRAPFELAMTDLATDPDEEQLQFTFNNRTNYQVDEELDALNHWDVQLSSGLTYKLSPRLSVDASYHHGLVPLINAEYDPNRGSLRRSIGLGLRCKI